MSETLGLLAIDLGTRTGWALAAGAERRSGFVDFKAGRFEGGGMRFLKFKRWLDEMAVRHPILEVRFEEVRAHRGVDAAHVYGGLLATLTAWCEERAIPYGGVGVGTIKRSATGNGRADKQDMMLAASELVGRRIDDDNEADAICLRALALKEISHA